MAYVLKSVKSTGISHFLTRVTFTSCSEQLSLALINPLHPFHAWSIITPSSSLFCSLYHLNLTNQTPFTSITALTTFPLSLVAKKLFIILSPLTWIKLRMWHYLLSSWSGRIIPWHYCTQMSIHWDLAPSTGTKKQVIHFQLVTRTVFIHHCSWSLGHEQSRKVIFIKGFIKRVWSNTKLLRWLKSSNDQADVLFPHR